MDIWGLIPSIGGMVCSTGLGTVLGNVAKEYTKDAKRYEKVAAGVSAYLLSGYLADKCADHLKGQVEQVKLSVNALNQARAKAKLMAAKLDSEDEEDDDIDEEDD